MEHQSADQDGSAVLEQFRQEWKQEVYARSQKKQTPSTAAQPRRTRRESASKSEKFVARLGPRLPLAETGNDDDSEEQSPRSEIIERIEGLRVKEVDEDDFSIQKSDVEPKSALEHYERAVEKESQGNLGDSLSHYRQAYRLDAAVDQTYKMKHFPGKWKPPAVESTASSSTTTKVSTVEQAQESNIPATFTELIASYAGLPIPGAKPMIEGDVEPPCVIRRLPTEVLMELLLQVAIADPCVYTRLALVCKRLAYHVFTDNSMWKRVALGPEFGLASQKYHFATDLQGREAIFRTLEDSDDANAEPQLPPVDETLFDKGTDFREVFHSHPRIRFSGVYISTVNYTRAGGVSATPRTWTSNVHIVTYYRYLRFFRDGTLISLLTTTEPIDVVHHLTKENIAYVRSTGKNMNTAPSSQSKDAQPLPAVTQTLLKQALRGRWKLCHPAQTDDCNGEPIGANVGITGDIHIETEGAAPRYIYTMHLSLKSSSRSKHTAKNNKLIWKGFWKYNHLTDDRAEFALKNDKAFFFSRVKSYGLGY